MRVRRSLEFILPSKDTTYGHWRFRGDLTDSSLHTAIWRLYFPNGHDLIGVNLNDADYDVGMTEIGVTSQFFAATISKAILPALSATLFDMGMGNFSIEVIFQTTASECYLVRKYSYSESSETGYSLKLTGGKPQIRLCATPVKFLTGATAINDGRWHYLAVTVDRTTNLVHMYIDGVEDANSPLSIAGMTGNLSNPPVDLVLGYNLNGRLDEICITKEVIGPLGITARAVGRFVEISEYDPAFLDTFLPGIDRENEDLRTFLIPFTTQLQEVLHWVRDLHHLPFHGRCPEAFLTHMASNLGFELIDLPFADENERRQLLRDAVEIYRLKGTLGCIDALCTLLGFTATLTEVFSTGSPMICNYHRLWDRSLVATSSFIDDFSSGNLALWNTPLNTTAWWRIDDGELVGTGNGADDPLNALLFDDSAATCLFSVEYTPDGTLVAPAELGLYLRYQDPDNWVRIKYKLGASSSQGLVLHKKVAGAETIVTLITFDNADGWFNSGTHTLWVWDDGADNYTAGMDDQTLVYDYAFACTGVARGKKGLWVNRGATVAFSQVTVDTHTLADAARIYDPDFAVRKLQIALDDPAGDHTDAKKEYLHRILPNYVPAGVEIEWI